MEGTKLAVVLDSHTNSRTPNIHSLILYADGDMLKVCKPNGDNKPLKKHDIHNYKGTALVSISPTIQCYSLTNYLSLYTSLSLIPTLLHTLTSSSLSTSRQHHQHTYTHTYRHTTNQIDYTLSPPIHSFSSTISLIDGVHLCVVRATLHPHVRLAYSTSSYLMDDVYQ